MTLNDEKTQEFLGSREAEGHGALVWVRGASIAWG